MTIFLPPDAVLYGARLGPGARLRGDRVVCQWLAWAGADDSLAQVRIVSSTVGSIPCGRVGLVPCDRLVPLRRPALPRRRVRRVGTAGQRPAL